ncbi:hypothetical protein cgR_6038 [Corynebacterium glutamicum R]|uniref:Uncharacterized protein n=1 Tax=Corynebacterium glutamicum (strain R) TaxID=340322 RepID=A0AB72VFI0_CORGB|nr:hypothetical protein cgR_6038 [Corynebacterium glutamicum R]
MRSLPLLRTRGGISQGTPCRRRASCSSPHTRRYFLPKVEKIKCINLFSAHAEVFPEYGNQFDAWGALLRTRGGISSKMLHYATLFNSSPHTRRYFLRPCYLGRWFVLFSAHAEVFPIGRNWPSFARALLRTRGGISSYYTWLRPSSRSSPHTRRYFHDT